MGRRCLLRLAVAENGVAAIDAEMQFVPAVAKAFGDLLPRPGGDEIDVRDRVRVAHADDADVALADLARAFELHPQFGCQNVAGPGHADGALVILLVMAPAHVDVAAEEMFVERVRPLVHRMAGDRGDRAALLGQQPASSSSALPRHRPKSSSQLTLCWREMDSNYRSPVRWAGDSGRRRTARSRC